MSFSNNTTKNLFRLSGIVVLCCIIVAFFSGFRKNSPIQSNTLVSAVHKPTGTTTQLDHDPAVHLSHFIGRSIYHLSIRSKHQGKPLFRSGSAILTEIFRLQNATTKVAEIFIATASLTRPGNYLFLFRYALF